LGQIVGLIAGFAAVGLGATAKGVLGFGFPLITVPLLAGLLGARPAVLVAAIPAFLANLLILRTTRRHPLQPWFLRMAAAVLVGAVAGALLFSRLPVRALTLGLGIVTLALVFGLGRGPRSEATRARLRAWGAPFGLAVGVLGGATDISGPGLVAFLSAIEREPDRFLFSLMILYVILNLSQITTLVSTGAYTPPLLLAAAAACVPMAVGVQIGARVRARLASETFRRLVLAVVVISALNLVRQGLMG